MYSTAAHCDTWLDPLAQGLTLCTNCDLQWKRHLHIQTSLRVIKAPAPTADHTTEQPWDPGELAPAFLGRRTWQVQINCKLTSFTVYIYTEYIERCVRSHGAYAALRFIWPVCVLVVCIITAAVNVKFALIRVGSCDVLKIYIYI